MYKYANKPFNNHANIQEAYVNINNNDNNDNNDNNNNVIIIM